MIWELYSDSFSGCPGSDECQHRKWPLAHERPRVTQKVPSGVIHQKLRLERAQHAGYLLVGLRGVFMHFLMDPDKTLQRFVLYRYTSVQVVMCTHTRIRVLNLQT